MRSAFFALILLAAGCDASVDVSDKGDSQTPAGGYTLEVRADQAAQIYLVTTPDGKTVAARAENGTSTLMQGRAVQALANQPMPTDPTQQEVVSLRVPGVNLSVSGSPDSTGEDGTAHVTVDAGGHSVEVNAEGNGEDNGPNNRAHVRITGATEEEARDFVNKAEKISPDVQAQMLAALGLDHEGASSETTATTATTP